MLNIKNYLFLGLALFLVACDNSKKESKKVEVLSASPRIVESSESEVTLPESEKKIENKEKTKKKVRNEKKTKKEKKEEVKKNIEEVKQERTIEENIRNIDKHAKKIEKKDEKKLEKKPVKEETPDVVVKKRIEELKNLSPGHICIKWINDHAETRIISTRVFRRDLSKSSSEMDKYFSKTFSEFIAANIVSFLPLIKNYEVINVLSSRSTKKFKQFTIRMRQKDSNEDLEVIVLATNNLRIVDISVQETSLISLLTTCVQDIMNQKKNQKAAWDKIIKKKENRGE